MGRDGADLAGQARVRRRTSSNDFGSRTTGITGTIRTLLARLVEKGALEYEVDGPRYIYRAAVSRGQCVRQKGRTFLEKTFGGDVGALLAHFVTEASLDQDLAIDQLHQLLDEKKSPGEEGK